MESHISEQELAKFRLTFPPEKPWYIITGVSTSIFSPCRHCGGGRIEGAEYVYCPPTDELIRGDLLVFAQKLRREAAKAERARLKAIMEQKERSLFE